MQQRLSILGAGRMGMLTAFQLAATGDYAIQLIDTLPEVVGKLQQVIEGSQYIAYHCVDVSDMGALEKAIKAHQSTTVVSCLPYFLNRDIARFAAEHDLNYFDLTEDTENSALVQRLAKDSQRAFVPQCGIAPGFINTIADHNIKQFADVTDVILSVGALPLQTSNHLQYALNWSTEGLINEYANLCDILEEGKLVQVPALEGLQSLIINGRSYEMFYTSGGVGSLVSTYKNKVKNLCYKTIRYPGHCEKMRFMMNDMNLVEDRDKFKRILEQTLASSNHDVVLLYVTVSGLRHGRLHEMSYCKEFTNAEMGGMRWSAIQLTTTTALCTAIDVVLQHPGDYQGLIKQEQISYDHYRQNRFGRYFSE